MRNNIYEEMKEKVILEEGKEAANNKKEWEKYLKSFLINYAKEFSILIKKKNGKISEILEKINLDDSNINLRDQDVDFLKCLLFLQSGIKNLFIIRDNELIIKPEGFDNYSKIEKKERSAFEKNIKIFEENYDLDGLMKLESELQFIINFFKDFNVRKNFFVDYLKNVNNYEAGDYNFLVNEMLGFNRSNYMSA